MNAGVSKVRIEENLRNGQASQAGLRGKWGFMPRKALEGSPDLVMLPPLHLRLRDGTETLKNPRSVIMKIVQIMVISR